MSFRVTLPAEELENAQKEREREGKVFESENSFADALSRKSGEEGRIWVVVSV